MKIFETVDVLDKCRKITDNPKKKEYWEKKIYEVIGRGSSFKFVNRIKKNISEINGRKKLWIRRWLI